MEHAVYHILLKPYGWTVAIADSYWSRGSAAASTDPGRVAIRSISRSVPRPNVRRTTEWQERSPTSWRFWTGRRPTRPYFTRLYRHGTTGDTIPLGAGPTLRVIETRLNPDDELVLVVEMESSAA